MDRAGAWPECDLKPFPCPAHPRSGSGGRKGCSCERKRPFLCLHKQRKPMESSHGPTWQSIRLPGRLDPKLCLKVPLWSIPTPTPVFSLLCRALEVRCCSPFGAALVILSFLEPGHGAAPLAGRGGLSPASPWEPAAFPKVRTSPGVLGQFGKRPCHCGFLGLLSLVGLSQVK